MFGDNAKEREAEKKKIETDIKAVIELGHRCLSNPDFAKYKERLEKLKKQCWRLLVDNPNPDPLQDAFFTRVLLNKIDVLSMLVEEVEKDAKRRI